MLGTPRAFRTRMEGNAKILGANLRAGDSGAGTRFWWQGKELVRKHVREHDRLARSDEHSSGIGLFGSESGHALQVRRGREDSRVQAGQPLALQEIEAGPVDGREVRPDGAGVETQAQGSDEGCRVAVRVKQPPAYRRYKRRGRGRPRHTKAGTHVWNGIENDCGSGCGLFQHQGGGVEEKGWAD